MTTLPRSFFARPALAVARDLLGCVIADAAVAVRLTEVEAYAGLADPASHAFRGPTARNRVMFGPAGHLYVYFTYGMHWCANVVCERDGTAAAVLLRAGEVVTGHEVARRRRPAARRDRDLARGPARLTEVLAITGGDSGTDLCGAGSWLSISAGPVPVADGQIRSGPRVGVAGAADRPWRLWLDGEPTVSVYRPAVPRRRAAH